MDATSMAAAPSAAQVAERVEQDGIELVRFLYVDHGGIVRGKSAAGTRIADRLRTGSATPSP